MGGVLYWDVDKRYTHQGFGEWLLVDALKRLLYATKPFFENLFYENILKILPIKAIEKLLPTIDKLSG